MVMSWGGVLHHDVSRGGSMVMLCPEGVQNRCPGGGMV